MFTNGSLPVPFSSDTFVHRPGLFDRGMAAGGRKNVMCSRLLPVSVCACLFASAFFLSAASTTNDVIAFGLRHSVITNAELELSDYENPLTVIHTAPCIDDGTNCIPESDAF